MTRPYISFAVSKLSQFMHAPSKHHWGTVKCLLRYLNGTSTLGIRLFALSLPSLEGFTNVDWTDNPDECTSMGVFDESETHQFLSPFFMHI